MKIDVAKAEQKIVAVLARMLVVVPESIKTGVRYKELLSTIPSLTPILLSPNWPHTVLRTRQMRMADGATW